MRETNSDRISLTKLLNKIPDKSVLLKDCPNPHFSILSHPLINHYPKWVGQSKSWAIFGTFSDYVIRKILLNLFPDRIRSNLIVASNAHRILQKSFFGIKVNNQKVRVLHSCSSKEATDFYKETESYINAFGDSSITWKDSLYEIFRLSHLDRVYRNKKLILPQISKELVLECIPFFENIEQWLQFKFKEAGEMFLNPTLGHELTLNADADLVIDSNLYEIKTVLYPDKYIKKDFHQLYGYVALFEYLKKHENSLTYKVLECSKIDTIGFIFPLFLQEITMDISKWKTKSRFRYLEKLLSFK